MFVWLSDVHEKGWCIVGTNTVSKRERERERERERKRDRRNQSNTDKLKKKERKNEKKTKERKKFKKVFEVRELYLLHVLWMKIVNGNLNQNRHWRLMAVFRQSSMMTNFAWIGHWNVENLRWVMDVNSIMPEIFIYHSSWWSKKSSALKNTFFIMNHSWSIHQNEYFVT